MDPVQHILMYCVMGKTHRQSLTVTDWSNLLELATTLKYRTVFKV
jgi:hypothetical protein